MAEANHGQVSQRPPAKMRVVAGILGVFGACSCTGTTIDVGPGSGGTPATENNAPGGGQTDDDTSSAATTGGSGPSGGTGSYTPTGTPGSSAGGLGHVACTDTTPLPVWPSTTACAGTSDLPVVGEWHGYVENAIAPWDEIFLSIKGANSDGVCGTITIGNATPPAPATDPNLVYPPGTWERVTLIPGYTLTLLDGTVDGARLRFQVSPPEAYQSWCALQTSYVAKLGANGCGCVPGYVNGILAGDNLCPVVDTVAGYTEKFNCDQASMCGSFSTRDTVCICNASGCGPIRDGVGDYFDLIVSGDTIEGSDTLHNNARMHFTREP